MNPISRKWIARAAQATGRKLDICGGGGVDNWRDSIAHIMAGARTVQMAAAPIVFGYGVFPETLKKIDRFLEHHRHASVEEIVGMALDHLKPLDQVPRRDQVRPLCVVDRDKCSACGQCHEVCFYEAILYKKGEKVSIVPERCEGCGLCTQVCPKDALGLVRDGKKVPVSWEGARGRIAESKRKV